MPHAADTTAGWTSLLKRGTLGRRILLWFLVVSLLPLLLSNTVGYAVSRRILSEQVELFLRSLAETQATQVAYELDRHRLGLEALIAGHPSFFESLDEAIAAYRSGRLLEPAAAPLNALLAHELSETPAFDEFFILGPGGYAVAATRRGRLEADWSEARFFTASRTGPVYELEWEERHGIKLPVFIVADPVLAPDGRRLGVFVAAAHFESHRTFLRIPPLLAGNVRTFLVSGDGRPLFVSHTRLPLNFAESLPSPLATSTPGSTIRYVNYENQEVVGTSAMVPGTSWLCILEVTVDLTLGQLRNLRTLSAALEGAFALLLVFIVWLVARSIVLPLKGLVAGAERIREGTFGVTVDVKRDDELGQLGHAFNQMSSEVERSAEEIRELHEQEMRRAAQLATVGELAAGVAHEIKNPVAGLSNGLDLLEKRPTDSQRTDDVLRQMRGQLQRMEAAIGDLLRFARPREPQLVHVEPAEIVDRAIGLVRSQADSAGISIEFRREAPGTAIMVDPEQLTQAVVNLALNGIQAMEQGGLLSLAIGHRSGDVTIEVADTGGGIAEQRIEEIFRPFVTTKHRGTGLGLAITRGIVERNGGRIEVESEPGEGSCFTLILPAVVEGEKEAS